MNTKFKIKNINFKNCILPASGTAGYGLEWNDFFNLEYLGAFVSKSLTREPRCGNKQPRLVFTNNHVYNSIGLENHGLSHFVKYILPEIKKKFIKLNYIVSIFADNTSDFIAMVNELAHDDYISGVELNFSCPNVTNALNEEYDSLRTINDIIFQSQKILKDKILLAKFSLFQDNILKLALTSQKAFANGLVISNTLSGLPMTEDHQYKIANKTCGISGTAIKDYVRLAISSLTKTIKIPIIACGGVTSLDDVLVYLKLGAKGVAIGSSNFFDYFLMQKIIKMLNEYERL